ncbi:hypothetical protein [Sediminibacillus albus]|uniref:hypothetical protein n=1 Tax=Sediminibacillus albus TaxID=407036 RepID=UPI001FE23FE2|nr:hypothetical protein [Sediminibacillus albus]
MEGLFDRRINGNLSVEYQAREVTSESEIMDFGYQESIEGWEQAFNQLSGNAEWVLTYMKLFL